MELITVAVGESKKEFPVYKSIICAKAPFFKAACKKEWSKKETRVVELPGVYESIFTQFLHWLYSGTVNLDVIDGFQEETNISYLGGLWALGDFLGMPDFGNQLLDCAIEEIRERPHLMPPNATVKEAPSGSTIRRLLVDHVASHADGEYILKDDHDWSREFIAKVLAAKYNDDDRASLDPLQQEKCYYPDHPEGSPKCA